ncbi:MAG: hypothetical protein J2P18_07945 [Nocardia sp.]|nr:hypothetical protein [Nocardia sp.]
MNNGAAAPDPVNAALREPLLREILRLHLASAPAVTSGWLTALRDPVLGPAMANGRGDATRIVDLYGT